MNRSLMVIEQPVQVKQKRDNRLTKPLRFLLYCLLYPIRYGLFGISRKYYLSKLVPCLIFAGLVAIYNYKVGIPLALNAFLYPYAKTLFPDKGRFKRYADEGITVTMTRDEYNRSEFYNFAIPYFLSVIFAPIAIVLLMFRKV